MAPNERQVVREDEAPYLFPKSLLAAVPAIYTWQVYGWPAALAVFVVVDLLLVALGWAYVLRDWSFRRLVLARSALVITAWLLIALSAAETCDPVCRRLFWP